MEELRNMLETLLHEEEGGAVVLSWSAIEGEPATFGVELADGRLCFIAVTAEG